MTTLSRIILRLARNPEAGYPEGDDSQGYVLVAPLDAEGRLDVEACAAHADACTVHRFTPDHSEDADGHLTYRDGRWFIRYDEIDDLPDEALVRVGEHSLLEGEYVTIRDPEADETLVYRVSERVDLPKGQALQAMGEDG